MDTDPRSRMRRTMAATTRVSIEEMAVTPGLLRTSLRWSMTLAVVFIVPLAILLDVYVAYLSATRPNYFGSQWAAALLMIFGTLFFAGLVWLIGVGTATRGIASSAEGVIIFERALGRSGALKRTLSWSSMGPPKLEVGSRIWVTGDILGAYLQLHQARAVLLDPRCPWSTRLPSDVAQALRAPDTDVRAASRP